VVTSIQLAKTIPAIRRTASTAVVGSVVRIQASRCEKSIEPRTGLAFQSPVRSAGLRRKGEQHSCEIADPESHFEMTSAGRGVRASVHSALPLASGQAGQPDVTKLRVVALESLVGGVKHQCPVASIGFGIQFLEKRSSGARLDAGDAVHGD